MIPEEDFTKQENIYTYKGKGKWMVRSFCPIPLVVPSLEMVDLSTNDTRKKYKVFGIKGTEIESFEPIKGLKYNYKTREVVSNVNN